MMDQELIRKAAEAIHGRYRQRVSKEVALRVELSSEAHHDHGVLSPFHHLSLSQRIFFCEIAKAALKVFYEHTRGQTRERAMPNCRKTAGL